MFPWSKNWFWDPGLGMCVLEECCDLPILCHSGLSKARGQKNPYQREKSGSYKVGVAECSSQYPGMAGAKLKDRHHQFVLAPPWLSAGLRLEASDLLPHPVNDFRHVPPS